MKEAHLILFDAQCPLCIRSVKWIIERDRDQLFLFAPLMGETAYFVLKGKEHLRWENTLILLENYKEESKRIWLRGRAAFRILGLLGGHFRALSWLAHVPFGVNLIYRLIARHRHLFGKKLPASFSDQERARILS